MEVAFQTILENQLSSDEVYKAKAYLLTQLSEMDEILNKAFELDIESGAFKQLGLLDEDNALIWGKLAGEDYLACENINREWSSEYLINRKVINERKEYILGEYTSTNDYSFSSPWTKFEIEMINTSICRHLLYSSAYSKIYSNPKSAFLLAIMKYLSEGNDLYLKGIFIFKRVHNEQFIFNDQNKDMNAENIKIKLINSRLAVDLNPKNISNLFNFKYVMEDKTTITELEKNIKIDFKLEKIKKETFNYSHQNIKFIIKEKR